MAIKKFKSLELSHYQTEVLNLLVETQAVRENLMLDMIVLQNPTESGYGCWRCTRPDVGSRKERLDQSVRGSWEEFKGLLRHGDQYERCLLASQGHLNTSGVIHGTMQAVRYYQQDIQLKFGQLSQLYKVVKLPAFINHKMEHRVQQLRNVPIGLWHQ
jgi:hypothetical protein